MAKQLNNTLSFFGSTISSDLKWELNVDAIVKKAQQRLYFLKRLRSFGLTTQITLNFYKAVIESVLTFSITVWFGSITVKEKLRLNRVVNTASKIIGRSLPSLESLYQPVSSLRTHPILPMIYSSPFHLVACSGPSKLGPAGSATVFIP